MNTELLEKLREALPVLADDPIYDNHQRYIKAKSLLLSILGPINVFDTVAAAAAGYSSRDGEVEKAKKLAESYRLSMIRRVDEMQNQADRANRAEAEIARLTQENERLAAEELLERQRADRLTQEKAELVEALGDLTWRSEFDIFNALDDEMARQHKDVSDSIERAKALLAKHSQKGDS